jgi:arabinose-5-phosphate isomerase
MKRIYEQEVLLWAKEVLTIEIDALLRLRDELSVEFIKAVEILNSCKGRIVVTGMGKAGIIGQKFSATLSSTGSSSFWLHAAEAVHGDLGRIKEDDVVVVLSYSGETSEVKNLIPFIERIGSKIVAITGNINSFLARYAGSTISVRVDREACALGLAPTTSTTAMLAMCDAISVVLMKLKKFKKEDFASFHPRGSLGRQVLKVKDIMRKGRLSPTVMPGVKLREVLAKISTSHAGAAVVVDTEKKVIGIFTDGDLRRKLEKHRDILNRRIEEVMTVSPIVVKETDLATKALNLLKKKKIDEVPVVDGNRRLVGVVDVQDLITAGIL